MTDRLASKMAVIVADRVFDPDAGHSAQETMTHGSARLGTST